MTEAASILERVMGYLRLHETAHLDDLAELIAIPSVSSDPGHADDVLAAAEHLAAKMRRIGLDEVAIDDTAGRPIVRGGWSRDDGRPVVLVYCHYDVQPAGRRQEWASDPFVAKRADDRLIGRGASDDKGQLWMHLMVVHAFLEVASELPVDIRFLFDGEEEVGSPNLGAYLAEHPSPYRADIGVVTDGSMAGPGIPSIGYGVRGLLYIDVTLDLGTGDRHSGIFGGAIPNAATALARMIATLHDDAGHVNVPGFYDAVRVPDAPERLALAASPIDEGYFERMGITALAVEAGFGLAEAVGARPVIEVSGLAAGHTGEGIRTIIPGRALASLSCRLVPDQDPRTEAARIEEHLRSVAPPGASLDITVRAAAPGAVLPRDHIAVDTAAAALEAAFRRPAVLIRHGGSIPVVAHLRAILGLDSIILGFGLPEGNAHGPDEWLSLDHYRRGQEAIARLWTLLGEVAG